MLNVVWRRAASLMGDFGPGGVEGRLLHCGRLDGRTTRRMVERVLQGRVCGRETCTW
jgi:hypothetical protein